MSYTITLSDDGRYIVCRVVGQVKVEIAREFAKEMDRWSRSLNVKRFLTDVREAPNASSTFENYEFAYKDLEELGVQRDARAAILVAPDDRTHDFVEMVVQNAGYGVKIFHDEESAVAWLTDEERDRGSG